MKKTLLAVTLLLLQAVIYSSPGWAKDHTLNDLTKEAGKLTPSYTARGNLPPKPQEADLLRRAADIMVEARKCTTAIPLYRQAALFSGQAEAELWLAVAKASSCAKNWKQASQTGWLAYSSTSSNVLRAEALALTGEALEQRTTSYHNWTPVGIDLYERLNKLNSSSTNAEKLARLRIKQNEDKKLLIRSYTADSSSGHPRLCIGLNDEILNPEQAHYGDYIRVSPALSPDFYVEYKKLCIGGASYGTTYEVTLRKGMKSRNKELMDTATFNIATDHSPSQLWFNQNDYILADVSGAVGLHTINVNKVKLRLYRIHERNILGEFVSNAFRRKLNEYELERIKEREGELVWEGSTDITAPQDEKTVSDLALPMQAIAAPGLYILIAEDGNTKPQRWEGAASQWLVKTNIGLTTYQGNDGLTVMARSLDTALPLAGVDITLTARNNTPLGTLTTDEKGLVRFAPGLLRGKGGQAAVQLVSMDSRQGFTFLQLQQAPFDFSDRGVGGRTAPGPVDAFVYTERGIYRPGETVNVVALVRDELGRAIDAPPLTLRLRGPNAKIQLERLLQPDAAGGYTETINLPHAARSGSWTASLYVDVKEKPVGQVSFVVKSFKPPRLDARMEPEGILTPKEGAKAVVQADYLYGSPGSNLRVQARMSLQYDPHPFADFANFFFGRAGEEPGIGDIELPDITTDARGQGTLILQLNGQQESTRQPLKAVVSAEVMDIDGRTVAASTGVPVRHLPEYLGVKPGFQDEQVQADSTAKFSLIALDGKGLPQAKGSLSYRLIQEEVDYQWFQKNGGWGYERIVRDHEKARDQLSWKKTGPLPLALPVTLGVYRLELLNKDAELVTAFRFTAGEQLIGQSDTPDAVKVELDRQQYQVGETAKLTIKSPYPGQASLILANSSIHDVSNISLAEGKDTLEIPVKADWGAGVYALVTVYRPGEGQKKGADRAVGLVWLNVDPAAQRLQVAIKTPDKIRPRQTLKVPVEIKDAVPGEAVHLTLAAVDDGVLRLTNFVSPDPLTWFFNKQQLGLEIRDLYGQLIAPPESKPLVLRTGAGENGLRGAPESNIKVLSLFSGVVQVGEDGTATVPLEIPDFNGRVRLMSVAWSPDKLGSASRDMQINDPVVVSPALPRYLAQGDESSIQLLLENIDGPEGEYHIAWTAEGAVAMETEEREEMASSLTINLASGKRENLRFPVQANSIGKGSLHVQVKGPEGYSYSGDFPLNVRGKYLPTLERRYAKLNPGESVVLDKETLTGLFPETAKVGLTISSSPNLDVPGLLGQLDRYPYGCLEQLTSRAMPLLSANLLAERFAAPLDKNLPGRVQEAIDRILQKQRGDGSFSLWWDSGSAKPWLTAYALDFLSRAQEKGYVVPEYFYKKGMHWLTDQVKNANNPQVQDLAPLAYAHWVLARTGQGRHEDARYLFDTWFQQTPSPLAKAQLAGSLALLGDRNRAIKGLKAAMEQANRDPSSSWHNYGSRLRDLAGIIHVIAESGITEVDPAPAWQELTRLFAQEKYLSTQEQAWLIMASLTLEQSSPLDLDIAEKAPAKEEKKEKEKPSLLSRIKSMLSFGTPEPPESEEPADAQDEETEQPAPQSTFFALERKGEALLSNPVTITNNGDKAVWLVTTLQGSPIEAPAPVENGFTVFRDWYTTEGEPMPVDAIQQGELMVVTLQGEVKTGSDFQALLVDLLPAGFEIERPITEQDTAFSWLKDQLTNNEYVDARDDRFIAAFHTKSLPRVDGNKKMSRFQSAYLVRAVTPGIYTLPPVEVEAMYRPVYRARGGVGTVIVSGVE
ncbi:MAG: alpha-2-macroglobulin [Candidatus Electrothrix aestuarii]|uniref:Alpha-2-macroglobulin n=1 Tax=Candidatus Electrothrix aestuarii TaxID=3062594 RepID=A0AAU8LYP1_9BACT|nr:alpha-2-macroglobulin [Candidatus Electrothrix aestuarii]